MRNWGMGGKDSCFGLGRRLMMGVVMSPLMYRVFEGRGAREDEKHVKSADT
jgi:hypothetical protein